jgi:heme o synthase
MKTAASLASPLVADALPRSDEETTSTAFVGRVSAFVSLTKPRIAVMVLLTVAVGFLLGDRHAFTALPLWMTLIGTALVAGGASAWNQVLERDRDQRMRRTAGRPLPSGRVNLAEAALFGSILGVLGIAILSLGARPLAAGVAFATFVLYVAVYTPLKPITTLNTAIGAIPGALPPVIGWAAATGELGIQAWALFLIVYLWQFPHFLAIAWIYRDDYARAGYKMLPNVDPQGAMTGRQAVSYALALVPAGLLPAVVGLAGPVYFLGALILGLFYLACATRFWWQLGDRSARRLLYGSFLYLPAILLLLLLNPAPI